MKVVHERIGSDEYLAIQIDAEKYRGRDPVRVCGDVDDARKITPVLDLEAVLIGWPISGCLRVGEKGVGENAHALATGKVEDDEERCAVGGARVHDAAAARYKCVANELEERRLIAGADSIDLP